MVLTDARLEQGARAAASGELSFDKRLIGPFLGWLGKDVEKETQLELQASGLTWKQVQKGISAKAREWYTARAESLQSVRRLIIGPELAPFGCSHRFTRRLP
jgi:hypothetical protein